MEQIKLPGNVMRIIVRMILELAMPGHSAIKKPTNLSLDNALLDEARSLKVNLSRAAEAGLRQAIADAKAERWSRENAAALEESNRWVEAKGLPLDQYRQF
jgi:antitoxin CcdA